MCWVSEIELEAQIAKEDIPIFKICKVATTETVISFYRNFVYELGKTYSDKESLRKLITVNGSQTISEGFHSYSPLTCYTEIHQINPISYMIYIKYKHIVIDGILGLSNIIKVNGIIPKDSIYYLNNKGEYVSNSIKLLNYKL